MVFADSQIHFGLVITYCEKQSAKSARIRSSCGLSPSSPSFSQFVVVHDTLRPSEMPSIPIHLPSSTRSTLSSSSLPSLLHTPLGYALLELQGTINFPTPSSDSDDGSTEVGRLVFPDYEAPIHPTETVAEGAWMKRVWLYVGFQRMTGSVVRLSKPLAIVRRRDQEDGRAEDVEMDDGEQSSGVGETTREELEIVEIVEWKIVFRSRPEPVGLVPD